MTQSEDIQQEPEEIPDESDETLGTYSAMFAEYLTASPWAKAAEHMLVVFHVRKVCKQLDDGGLEKAAMSGAYLNAIRELERRRPGARRGSPSEPDDPDQTSIFDHMDDG